MHVAKGTAWKDIPTTIVIFITEHDILKGGEPIYHAERTIRELNGKRFEDDAEIIYVNSTIQDDTPLGLLMQDFYCKDPEKMHSKVLAERARYFKSDEHGVMKMCEIMEKFAKSYAKGEREEGKSEGKALMMRIFKLLQAKTPFASIAEETKVSLDEVRQIAKDYGIAY